MIICLLTGLRVFDTSIPLLPLACQVASSAGDLCNSDGFNLESDGKRWPIPWGTDPDFGAQVNFPCVRRTSSHSGAFLMEKWVDSFGQWLGVIYAVSQHPYVNPFAKDDNGFDAWYYAAQIEDAYHRQLLQNLLDGAMEHRKLASRATKQKFENSLRERNFDAAASILTVYPVAELSFSDINKLDERGRTILHDAAADQIASLEVIAALCRLGASALTTDMDGQTPLDVAFQAANFTKLECLLDFTKGSFKNEDAAVLEILSKSVPASEISLIGMSKYHTPDSEDEISNPLYRACTHELQFSTVQTILQRAKHIHNPNMNHGRFLLQAAIKHNRSDTVKALLDSHVNVNTPLPVSSVRDTPLGYGIRYFGNSRGKEIMNLLLESGADTKVTGEDGETYLHLIAKESTIEALQTFLFFNKESAARSD
ncbi:hypothetical protein ABW19_dt0206563 [Dactylella cylindrospora]|nr:hypothetical protein ABW19_dt0206563 [Dactylella cylindrospora]